jgi:hypothetical protein
MKRISKNVSFSVPGHGWGLEKVGKIKFAFGPMWLQEKGKFATINQFRP